MSVKILQGDNREVLKTLPDESVHCCVTSPPYWGLRSYCAEGTPEKQYEIGLESTPEAYVAELVAVFREVKRVLRGDGTLWLNLGDSYAGSGKGSNPDGTPHPSTLLSKSGTNRGCVNGTHLPQKAGDIGLNPKDLVGIPWRVAFALQQPYYSGKILREQDRIWLACAIEAEGCLFIHKRKAGQSNGQGYHRQNDNYGPGLEVANTSLAFVERCKEITGLGTICSQSPNQNHRRKQTIYRWNVRTLECRDIIREVYPYLIGKQHQARLLLSCPPSGEDADKAHRSLMLLHNGYDALIDFPPPASLFEKGYYLRQDIIWNKCNPMPESVTDRCTKSHEYIFLLSKSARYFYDAAAIAEPAIYAQTEKSFSTPYNNLAQWEEQQRAMNAPARLQ